jgi:CheY-like chemotaxis protein
VSINALLQEELDPYMGGSVTVEIVGPDLVLTSKAALALSLAIHELATNAAKFGAMSTPGGRVAIRWEHTQSGGLSLGWTESGGPAVHVPTRRGFGSTLIERALAMETDGVATLRYLPGGVVCDVVLPPAAMAAPVPAHDSAMIASSHSPVETGHADSSIRVLVVEDSFMIANMLELVFDGFGWTLVGPAARVPKALALIETEKFDAALLDINLDGEMSWPVAEALRARGIPFVLSTGYEIDDLLPESLKGSWLVKKPYNTAELERVVLEAIRHK